MLSLLQQVKDPYERKARVTPALLVALPVLVPLVCVYGPKHPILMAVVGLLAACGVIYALASIVRGQGKKLEERLVQEWGGLPSTIALRHRDGFFDSVTKKRYHDDIVNKLGIPLPTPEEETSDPAKADNIYMGATRRLRELTRDDNQLLLNENIAYGFHRNMLAMKVPGILSSLIGTAYGLVLANALSLTPLKFDPERLTDPGLDAGVTLAISLLLLLTWCLYFDKDQVRLIGFVYAERLFEHLPALPVVGEKKRPPRGKKTSSIE